MKKKVAYQADFPCHNIVTGALLNAFLSAHSASAPYQSHQGGSFGCTKNDFVIFNYILNRCKRLGRRILLIKKCCKRITLHTRVQ